MYIKNGIAYAGESEQPLKVSGVRPLPKHQLWVRFSNGQAKVVDFKPLLDSPAFAPLKDETVFHGVYIDYGVAVWCDGDIDIGTDYLFMHGVAADGISA